MTHFPVRIGLAEAKSVVSGEKLRGQATIAGSGQCSSAQAVRSNSASATASTPSSLTAATRASTSGRLCCRSNESSGAHTGVEGEHARRRGERRDGRTRHAAARPRPRSACSAAAGSLFPAAAIAASRVSAASCTCRTDARPGRDRRTGSRASSRYVRHQPARAVLEQRVRAVGLGQLVDRRDEPVGLLRRTRHHRSSSRCRSAAAAAARAGRRPPRYSCHRVRAGHRRLPWHGTRVVVDRAAAQARGRPPCSAGWRADAARPGSAR